MKENLTFFEGRISHGERAGHVECGYGRALGLLGASGPRTRACVCACVGCTGVSMHQGVCVCVRLLASLGGLVRREPLELAV